MKNAKRFLCEHRRLTRRYFLRLGAAGAAALKFWPLNVSAGPPAPVLAKAIEALEPYFTPVNKFRDVSRGKPLPHSLSDEKKRTVGLTTIRRRFAVPSRRRTGLRSISTG
jgi:hypothetical protein